MAVEVNEGAYRISGRFGEGFFIDPSGKRAPMKIVEATAITFTKELEVQDVPLAGNKTGSKDGAEQPGQGSMTLQKIDEFFENLIREAFNPNLEERRRRRDTGQRISRTFTLQVWQDDPEALGAIGHQLEGVRLSRIVGGFDYGQAITEVEHPFRFERLRPIRAFERVGNQVNPDTGLPEITYTVTGSRAVA